MITEYTCGVPSEWFHFSTRLIILQQVETTILNSGISAGIESQNKAMLKKYLCDVSFIQKMGGLVSKHTAWNWLLSAQVNLAKDSKSRLLIASSIFNTRFGTTVWNIRTSSAVHNKSRKKEVPDFQSQRQFNC